MQVTSSVRRLARVSSRAPSFLNSVRFLAPPDARTIQAYSQDCFHQWRNHSTFLSRFLCSSGIIHGDSLNHGSNYSMSSMRTGRASFSSDASSVAGSSPTEAAKEVYDKMLQSVKARTMPPNAWLWSLIEKCANTEDIKLLFDILKNLRTFRLSNLRIHSDFNANLCREITKLYAKEHNDVNLMVEIMKLLKRNDLPLQPGTADIVFSICYNADNWPLTSKYSKKFVMAGVKLRQTSFDLWMDFAAKIGDIESLWKVEKLHSETMKKHTLATGFACAKGFLLEQKPDNAADIIQVLYQGLSDAKKPGIAIELQKLVSEWPLEVIKHQKEDHKMALAASLKKDIPAMVSGLLSTGIEFSVDMEELNKQEGILS